jgi:hypothetical protein
MELAMTGLSQDEIKVLTKELTQRYGEIPPVAKIMPSRHGRWWVITYLYASETMLPCGHCTKLHGSDVTKGGYWDLSYWEGYNLLWMRIGVSCLDPVLSICRTQEARRIFGLCGACGAFRICRDLFERICHLIYEIDRARHAPIGAYCLPA